jgi:hypothetical protein
MAKFPLEISFLRRIAIIPGRIPASSQWSFSHYWIALFVVISMLVLIVTGQIIFGSARLMLLAVAVLTVSRYTGIAGGVFSVVLTTLAADFFFLPPVFALNLDQTTWIVGAKYSIVALLSYAIFRRRQTRAAHTQPVPVPTPARGPVGHLGQVKSGEIYGWAMNPDDPNWPEKITAHVNGRPVAEALAVYYRPDVAERLNCSGRCGFYFDLSQFGDPDTDAVIDVRLSNGRSLEGGPVRAHLPRRQRGHVCTLLFMHIPKTAGTALRETILNNYRQSEVAYIYPDPPGFPVRDLRDLPLVQRTQFRLVVGHFQYGLHDQIPNDYRYFTIVRNPTGRVHSHYAYLVQHGDPLLVQDGHAKTLEEALEGRVTANLDNLMVRCFAGVDEKDFPPGSINSEVYDLAVRHAENAFLYIGQQEHLAQAYSFLQAKFGWTWDAPPEIMNPGSYAREEGLGKLEADLIRRFNTWDVQLYEHIRKIFQ